MLTDTVSDAAVDEDDASDAVTTGGSRGQWGQESLKGSRSPENFCRLFVQMCSF